MKTHAISLHPFKEGIYGILAKHFAPHLVKKFRLDFETELYNKELPGIWKQRKDGVLILEVRFQQPNGTYTYICDVWSIWSKQYTEHHLLRYITDKIKEGKLYATNWREVNGKISDEVLSGKHETHAITSK